MARTTTWVLVIFALIGYIYCAHTGETDCQRRRRNEQHATRNLTGLLVPECDEHGEYKAIQCFGETVRGRPFCACYDREFGQIRGPSRSLRSCNCIRAHHDWEHSRTSGVRPSEPRCDTTTGEYNPVQCDTEQHWCVDTDTGVPLAEKQRGGCHSDLSHVSCPRSHSDGHSGSTRHSESSHGRGSSHHDDTSHRESSGSHGSSGSRGSSGSHSGSSSSRESGRHSDSTHN